MCQMRGSERAGLGGNKFSCGKEPYTVAILVVNSPLICLILRVRNVSLHNVHSATLTKCKSLPSCLLVVSSAVATCVEKCLKLYMYTWYQYCQEPAPSTALSVSILNLIVQSEINKHKFFSI